MTDMIGNLLENVTATASLASALIAATVTLAVFILNQAFSRRQQRVQFLQPKYEQLYLRLNDVSERNARIFKLLVLSIHGDKSAKDKLGGMDELELYGHLTAKEMVMIVRLYFPKLSRIHQLLFAAERQLSERLWELFSGTHPSEESILEASGKVGHMIRLMEQEMVMNQTILLKDTFLFRFYRAVGREEIENVPPPPQGPPLAGI